MTRQCRRLKRRLTGIGVRLEPIAGAAKIIETVFDSARSARPVLVIIVARRSARLGSPLGFRSEVGFSPAGSAPASDLSDAGRRPHDPRKPCLEYLRPRTVLLMKCFVESVYVASFSFGYFFHF